MQCKRSSLFIATSAALAIAMQSSPAPPARASAERVLHLQSIGKTLGLSVRNPESTRIGKLEDLCIEPSDGTIACAVVAEGGVAGIGKDRCVVPWNLLELATNGDGRFVRASVTAAQLRGAPTIAKSASIDASVLERARAHFGRFDAARAEGEPIATDHDVVLALDAVDRKHSSHPSTFLSCRTLLGHDLFDSGNRRLGTIDDLVFDADERCVACMVVATGGLLGAGRRFHAVPWQGTVASPAGDGALELSRSMTLPQLERAPTLEDPRDLARMSRESWMRELDSSYGVEPYWTRTQAMPAQFRP